VTQLDPVGRLREREYAATLSHASSMAQRAPAG
jgi:hypothetical protein